MTTFTKSASGILTLLVAISALSLAAVPAPTFNAPWLTFNTGLTATAGSPIALATGDANGDGDLV